MARLNFEWDERKANINVASHGISFKTAIGVFTAPGVTLVETTRPKDGESRFKAIGMIEHRLYSVVFTMRGDVYRLISARRANTKEERIYGYRPL